MKRKDLVYVGLLVKLSCGQLDYIYRTPFGKALNIREIMHPQAFIHSS